MKISIIVPSNNTDECNKFIKSYLKLVEFTKYSKLIIIGNGKLNITRIIKHKSINCVYLNEKESELIPFLKYRLYGMNLGKECDYFLLLDDDHRFGTKSDSFLMNCLSFLENKRINCSVLCTDRKRDGVKEGIYNKINSFIWTNRGLFLKNYIKEYNSINPNLLGAGEDQLLAYIALNEGGSPYTYYGSCITRKEKRWKEGKLKIINPSYLKENMDKNIIGYIKSKFNDSNWNHKQFKYPKDLQEKLDNR